MDKLYEITFSEDIYVLSTKDKWIGWSKCPDDTFEYRYTLRELNKIVRKKYRARLKFKKNKHKIDLQIKSEVG